jgi:hypothetical protein
MLEQPQVEQIINNEICSTMKWARDYSDKLLVHVEGIGLDKYLARINNYENINQFEARKKHAVSNKFLIEELLRPVDNAFHARGGSKSYKFTTDSEKKQGDLIGELTNVKNDLSLSQYIESVWFNKFVTDPNGLIYMEVNGVDEDAVIEPTYKSIHSIRAYQQNGLSVDWIVFEPHSVLVDENNPKDLKKVKKLFWVVDEAYYYLYEKNSDGVIEVDRVENSFGKVPAILCSNIIDNVTGWKKSPIDSQVELLDRYLVSNSVLTIAEFFHNYPQQWTYIDECARCNGTGNVNNGEADEVCSTCDGTGKAQRKDVTDIIQLKIPEGDQQKIAPDISGYIYMPTEPWQLMTDTVDRYWNTIYFSHWGTTVSKGVKNETATGRFLDAQPVNNRLNKYTSSIETAHTLLANLIGEFKFKETFEKAVVRYGRRYMIETPDQIWGKYLMAKKDNAPVSVLDLLLNQYLESEFRDNEQLFVYEKKKTELEPFVHWDILIVKDLNVDKDDYYAKVYFDDWIKTKTIIEIAQTDIKALKEQLKQFINSKQLTNESKNVREV